ncbi:MAG: hypothetical protein LQ349_006436 [Xanthoria aureola]|nr:MAG: hypothetical protein LQ349_006436 [Xanthoria aureola]
MVVFSPRCDPRSVLQVFSTVALTANLTSLFQYDFNVGSFAQFGDPETVARIDHRSERTDFRNISHLAIRQQLDAEDFLDEFILIDEHTAQSHAIWWVITTRDSKDTTEDLTAFGNPPVTYLGENFTLWQSHIMIQDIAYAYDSVVLFDLRIYDLIAGDRIHPYDPHDPQEPPRNEGRDYITKEHAQYLIDGHYITATFSEIMLTADPSITRYKWSKWCVALTPEAARQSGLLSPVWLSGHDAISEWWPFDRRGDLPPRPGDVIQLKSHYDWDSPRWPPPGVAAPFPAPTGNLSLASRVGRHPSHPTVGSPQQCVPRKPRKLRPTSPLVAISR